jgi:hypothetical protein
VPGSIDFLISDFPDTIKIDLIDWRIEEGIDLERRRRRLEK